MRDIDDPTLRRHLSYVLTTDYTDVGLATMQTQYRTNVRLVLPNDIQVAIRATCGDRFVRDAMDQHVYILPDHCALSLDPAKAAGAAKALRASASLPNELALHLGSIEAYLQNVDVLDPMRTLESDLDKR